MRDMQTVIVFGASDDLIEIEGDLREEFNPTEENGRTGMMLAFGDGTILDISYDNGGHWRVNRSIEGTAEIEKHEAIADEGRRPTVEGLPEIPAYSDYVILRGDLRWALAAEKPVLHPIGVKVNENAETTA